MGWIAVSWIVALAIFPVQVTPISGQPYSAELLTVSSDSVQLKVLETERSVPLTELSRLERSENDSTVGPTITIGLTNGSRLKGEAVSIEKTAVTIRMRRQEPFGVPLKQVAWIRYRSATPTVDDAWLGMIGQESANDRLVVPRSATSIDQMPGVVLSANETKVEFELSGKNVVPAPVDKLVGVIFGGTKEVSAGNMIVTDTLGSEWVATAVNLPLGADNLSMTLPDQTERKLSLNQLQSIRYLGNASWLAAEAPADKSFSPLVELPLDKKLLDTWFGPTSVNARDIVLRSRSKISFRVEPKHKIFATRLIPDPSVTAGTGADVRIYLDDQVVWNETILPTDSVRGIEISLGNARRLTLEVDFGEGDARGDTGDVIRFVEPRLMQ